MQFDEGGVLEQDASTGGETKASTRAGCNRNRFFMDSGGSRVRAIQTIMMVVGGWWWSWWSWSWWWWMMWGEGTNACPILLHSHKPRSGQPRLPQSLRQSGWLMPGGVCGCSCRSCLPHNQHSISSVKRQSPAPSSSSSSPPPLGQSSSRFSCIDG